MPGRARSLALLRYDIDASIVVRDGSFGFAPGVFYNIPVTVELLAVDR